MHGSRRDPDGRGRIERGPPKTWDEDPSRSGPRRDPLSILTLNDEESLGQVVDHHDTVVIRDRVMVASQPGMLPEDVLEDLIGKVKDLDMDEVRREMANTEEEKGDGS